MVALVYLNEANPLHKGKGWQFSTLFEDIPTVNQILDNSPLESGNPNDVKLAEMLVANKGRSCRLVYPGKSVSETFFEVMLIQVKFGEPLKLWDYFLTGYADMDESRQIMWEDYK